MIKSIAILIIHFITLSNLFCQPEQNYISRYEELEYSKHLHEFIKNSIQDSVHWKYQSASGFQNIKTSLHREINEPGKWSFFPINTEGKLTDCINVILPHQFPENRDYGAGWNTKRIKINTEKNKRLILKLNQVDIFCRLVINGQTIGNHFGGFTPFESDITDYMNDGANTLALYFYDQTASIDGNKAYNQKWMAR